MKAYVEIDGKIIGDFDIMKESLGDFLKKMNIRYSDVLPREVIILSLNSVKDKKQIKLKFKDE